MGKIKKILETDLVGGTQTTDVYPVTAFGAVYDENNNDLNKVFRGLNKILSIGNVSTVGYLHFNFGSTVGKESVVYLRKIDIYNYELKTLETLTIGFHSNQNDSSIFMSTPDDTKFKCYKSVENGNIDLYIGYEGCNWKHSVSILNYVQVFAQANETLEIVESVPSGALEMTQSRNLTPLYNGVLYTPVNLNVVGCVDSSGIILDDYNWVRSDYIAINEGDMVYYHLTKHANVCSVSFFDESHSFISGYPNVASGYVSAPAGSKYVMFSDSVSGKHLATIEVSVYDIFDDIDEVRGGNLQTNIIKDAVSYYGYIKSSDLTIVSDPNYKYTDYIGIGTGIGIGDSIPYRLYSQSEVASIIFYDADKAVISQVNGPFPYGYMEGTVEVPENTAFVRFCWWDTGHSGDSYINISRNINTALREIDERVIANEAQIATHSDEIDLLKRGYIAFPDIVTDDSITKDVGYLNKTGDISPDSNWLYTQYMSAKEGDIVEMSIRAHSSVASLVAYSVGYTPISYYGASSGTDEQQFASSITLPKNTKFIRICYRNPETVTAIQKAVVHRKILEYVTNLQSQINDLKSYKIDKDLWDEATILGYIDTSGQSTNSDDNWVHTDYIPFKEGEKININIVGHTAVNVISYYDSSKGYISGIAGESVSYPASLVIGIFTAPANTAYIRLSGGSTKYTPSWEVNSAMYSTYMLDIISSMQSDIDYLKSQIGDTEVIPYITPYKVYTVCNDCNSTLKGHNRNYSAAIYLDHMFNGLTEEKDITFGNGQDRVMFHSPMVVTDSNESSSAVTYNDGSNIIENDVTVSVVGKSVAESSFVVKHVSTLNSVTKSVTPKVLCIGDSITYAELATTSDDGYSQNWAYHLMCKELFMKDKIDSGESSGYDVLFLGHFIKQRKMTYKEQEYDVITHHEGIRGISLSSYLNGNVEAFKSDSTGKFSVNAWLSKYRTLDDEGNRLSVGDGTGTLINSGNINNIDVCTPTHILLMLGANGGGTLEQFTELINIIKFELPNVIIGITVSDTAGTYFPSKHPKYNDKRMTMWADISAPQGSRHNQQYNLMNMFNTNWGNESSEQENIYVLPFFFVQPTVESFSMRPVNLPDYQFTLTSDNLYNDAYGWHPSTHINAIGHTNWGYQLYSWLKYTIAKNLS